MRPFEFRWKNFRSFKDTKWREIKPLTIFIGPNNSGKTSLIAPFLLLKQSLKSFDVVNPLMIKGDYFDFGSFNQFVINHDSSCDVEFGFRFPYAKVEKQNKKLKESDMEKLSLVFCKGTERKSVRLKKFEIQSDKGISIIRNLIKGKPGYSLYISKKSKDGLREKIIIKNEEAKKILLNHQPDRFLFYSQPILSKLIKIINKGETEKMAFRLDFTENISSYLGSLDDISYDIQDLFETIEYLGPLRDPPKRIYELSGELPFAVGATGKFAPEILFRYRYKPLLSDVNDWFKKFDNNIRMEPKGSFIEGTFLINLVSKISSETKEQKERDIKVNFADSGFGFSQILPIIVQGLHITQGELLIFEQPEIHLNPKYQSKLGDFFAYLISKKYKKNKFVIVETHSEHILLRIRTLIAKGVIDSSDVAIYYVERRQGLSEIAEIPIDPNGYIPDEKWPDGFFDDIVSESLEFSSAQREWYLKNKERENKP